jgi:NAD(P)H-dependent flavin oxidoreductase YrpB (nitropropane dioxygenase family)
MFNIDAPIFAFSHCRDVVVEVSKAGGLGVLGATRFTPRELEIELSWIDEHIGGRPYGVDVLIPRQSTKAREAPRPQGSGRAEPIPAAVHTWTEAVMRQYNVAPLPPDQAEVSTNMEARQATKSPVEHAQELLEVAFKHPIKLMVSALGPPPREVVDRAHGLGIKVCAMIGTLDHAIKQRDAGVDFVVATGTEAGGHTGYVSTMVLVPQIVDGVAPLPVLAAGGIGRGRQVAAALALGAEGVWCGSLWLTSQQSEVSPELKERLLAAQSNDAILSKVWSGKNCRILRSGWTDAWEQPGAPQPLAFPVQAALTYQVMRRVTHAKAKDVVTYPVGQIIGQITESRSVRQIFYDLLTEFAESADRFSAITNDNTSVSKPS